MVVTSLRIRCTPHTYTHTHTHTPTHTHTYTHTHTHTHTHMADEVKGDKAQESVRTRCYSYMERAEQLKKFIAKGKKKVHHSGTTASKEKKK